MKKILIKFCFILIISIFFVGIKSVYATSASLNKILDSYEEGIYAFASTEQYTFFWVSLADHTEMYRTDGTEEETLLLKNFTGDEYVYGNLNATNDKVFFVANDVHSSELWVSDGTVEGTHMVKDINPTGQGICEIMLTTDNYVYFVADDGTTGRELWVSDGTEDGTYQVKEFIPGADDATIEFLGNIGDTAYFVYSKYITGYEDQQLWKTDGTLEGTLLVKEIDYVYTNQAILFNDELYFVAADPVYGSELWKTNGTEAGTYMIKDIAPESSSSYPRFFNISNNKLYFVAYTSENGYQIYMTDGTLEGTSILDATLEKGLEDIDDLVAIDGILYFTAELDDGASEYYGNELWRSDGTEEGTYIVKDIVPGEGSSGIQEMHTFRNKLFFITNTGYGTTSEDEYTSELYESDGTEEGTVMLAYHLSQGEGAYPIYVGINGIYYNQATSLAGWWGTSWSGDVELWVYKPALPISNYSVIFKDFDGTTLKEETVEEGNGATAPTEPTRIGYTFTGWDVTFNNITASINVTAEYTINSYVVTFYDYDEATLKTETVQYGGSATAPTEPTRTGYTFTGWDVTFNNITASINVTAQYTINSYVVTFDNYNGLTLKTESVQYGGSATAPANPSRVGYIFTGWDKAFNNITSNLSVTAVYRTYQINNQEEVVEETVEPELEINKITTTIDETSEDQIKANIQILNDKKELIDVYDINLMLSGEKIQPDGYIEIRILMTEKQKEYTNLQVIYIDDDNNIEVLNHTIDGNYIVFSVNHLSKYAVVGEKKEVETPVYTNEEKTEEKQSNNLILITGGALLLLIILLLVFRKKKSQ